MVENKNDVTNYENVGNYGETGLQVKQDRSDTIG
jgi:hypothetical protein